MCYKPTVTEFSEVTSGRQLDVSVDVCGSALWTVSGGRSSHLSRAHACTWSQLCICWDELVQGPGCLVSAAWSPRVQKGACACSWAAQQGPGGSSRPQTSMRPSSLPACCCLHHLLMVQASHRVRPACRWHSGEERGRDVSSSLGLPISGFVWVLGVVLWLPAVMASVGVPCPLTLDGCVWTMWLLAERLGGSSQSHRGLKSLLIFPGSSESWSGWWGFRRSYLIQALIDGGGFALIVPGRQEPLTGLWPFTGRARGWSSLRNTSLLVEVMLLHPLSGHRVVPSLLNPHQQLPNRLSHSCLQRQSSGIPHLPPPITPLLPASLEKRL